MQREETRSISNPPGWDTNPSLGYPQLYVHLYPYAFMHMGRENYCERFVFSKNATQFPRPRPLDPETRALDMRPTPLG